LIIHNCPKKTMAKTTATLSMAREAVIRTFILVSIFLLPKLRRIQT